MAAGSAAPLPVWGAAEVCEERSAGKCERCRGWIHRSMRFRRQINGDRAAVVHASCASGRGSGRCGAPFPITSDLIAYMWGAPPDNARTIALRAGLSKSSVTRWLARFLEAGIARKAGDVYRLDRSKFDTLNAAIAAWNEHDARSKA